MHARLPNMVGLEIISQHVEGDNMLCAGNRLEDTHEEPRAKREAPQDDSCT